MKRGKVMSHVVKVLALAMILALVAGAAAAKEPGPQKRFSMFPPMFEPGFKQIADGIWVVRTFEEPPPDAAVNLFNLVYRSMASDIFIIEDGDSLIVFDAGWPGEKNLRNFTGGLQAMGRKPEDISMLVVSHWHIDHTGLAGTIREMSGCKVVAAEADAPLMTGEKTITLDDGEAIAKKAGGASPLMFAVATLTLGRGVPIRGETFQVDLAFKGDYQAGAWQALLTPGHTKGSLSFWNPSRKILIAGNWAKKIFEPVRPGKPRGGNDPLTTMMPDFSRQDFESSFQKLESLQPRPEMVISSHAGKLP